MTVGEAKDDVAKIIEQFHLLRDERAIFDHWQELAYQYDVHGKSAHDTRLIAAMQCHGISNLLTFNDKDFQRYAGISVIHPDNATSLPVKD